MISNKRELILTIQKNKDFILSCGVKRIGVFGSFARDTVNPKSDIDFFIEFNPGKKKYDNFIKLADTLEGLTGRHVELITKESLSIHLGQSILNEVEYVSFPN